MKKKIDKTTFSPYPWHIKPAEIVTRTFRSLGGRQVNVQTRIAILDSSRKAYQPRHTVCQITMGNPCHEVNARLLEKAPDMYNMLAYLENYLQDISAIQDRPGMLDELENKAKEIKILLNTINIPR